MRMSIEGKILTLASLCWSEQEKAEDKYSQMVSSAQHDK